MFSHADTQLSQHCLLKTMCFPPLNYVGTFVKNKWIIHVRVYFWILSSVPFLYISIHTPVLHLLINVSLQYALKLGSVSSPTLCFFQIVLAFLDLLQFHIKFRISLSISASAILIGIVLTL